MPDLTTVPIISDIADLTLLGSQSRLCTTRAPLWR
jgi:hypothetical protein